MKGQVRGASGAQTARTAAKGRRAGDLTTYTLALAGDLYEKLCQKTAFTLALLAPHMRLS